MVPQTSPRAVTKKIPKNVNNRLPPRERDLNLNELTRRQSGNESRSPIG